MFTLEDYPTSFTGSVIAHTALMVYVFVIMDMLYINLTAA